jgi:hypothetical protein
MVNGERLKDKIESKKAKVESKKAKVESKKAKVKMLSSQDETNSYRLLAALNRSTQITHSAKITT